MSFLKNLGNKAKEAVKIFDYIHSLDSQKLADILAKVQKNENKNE